MNIMFIFFSQVNIFVEPPRIENFYLKGKEYVEVLEIEAHNFSSHIEIFVEDFNINENGEVEFKPPGTFKFSLSPFVKIIPRSFDIEKNEKKEIRVLFTLPDTMKSYEKWCMVIIKAYPKLEKTAQVRIVGEIGVPIYAMVKNGFSIFPPSLIDIGKEKNVIYFIIENPLPVHIRTKGKVYILDEKKENVFEREFKDLVILPLKKRKFSFEIKENIKKGKYTLFCEIDYGGSEILLGEKDIDLP